MYQITSYLPIKIKCKTPVFIFVMELIVFYQNLIDFMSKTHTKDTHYCRHLDLSEIIFKVSACGRNRKMPPKLGLYKFYNLQYRTPIPQTSNQAIQMPLNSQIENHPYRVIILRENQNRPSRRNFQVRNIQTSFVLAF